MDDGFITSKKVLAIPRAVRAETVGLWTLCGVWSARELADGRIPAYIPEELGGSLTQADELVRVQLWHAPGSACDHTECGEAGPGEYLVHDWHVYQPSRAETLAKRADVSAKRSAAGAKGAASRWQKDGKAMASDSNTVASEQQSDGPVPVPVPVPNEQTQALVQDKPAQVLEAEFAEWWAGCWRKQAKPDALKAFKAARKDTSLAALIAGAQAYKLLNIGQDKSHLKMPAGWLRDRRWEDEQIPHVPAANTARSGVTPTERAMATLRLTEPQERRPSKVDQIEDLIALGQRMDADVSGQSFSEWEEQQMAGYAEVLG
ncbi:hypothetical protein E3T28_12810 [Cryobacterium sinapicolor]|uniref:Uncharacterized protein n=1 Tax=Cryobacterium sinapicolor TaxID=1259236 RepID=A0ABY2IWC4_9MICO|nr:hypothetical protein [Cryobacterium sinapicolor]TFC96219.1 hypothetical protein E3T28_12810 [Cryobacterium sinapicolor]